MGISVSTVRESLNLAPCLPNKVSGISEQIVCTHRRCAQRGCQRPRFSTSSGSPAGHSGAAGRPALNGAKLGFSEHQQKRVLQLELQRGSSVGREDFRDGRRMLTMSNTVSAYATGSVGVECCARRLLRIQKRRQRWMAIRAGALIAFARTARGLDTGMTAWKKGCFSE